MITPTIFDAAKKASLRRQTTHPITGKIRQRGGSLWWLAVTIPPRVGAARCVSTTTLVDTEKTGIGTACWQWDTSRCSHIIHVGDRIDEVFRDPLDVESESLDRVGLVKSAIAHEVCHAAYTDSPRPDVDMGLRANRLKFRFHNLAEDCRIEWRYLKERGKDHRFGWNRIDRSGGMMKPTNVASTYLWQLKSREPALFKHTRSAASALSWTGLPTFISGPYMGRSVTSVIIKFYDRFVAAKTEIELIPIEKEWVDIFGHDVESITGISDKDESAGREAFSSESSSAPETPSPVVSASEGGAMGETPTIQTSFTFPGDKPHDPTRAAHKGMSPITKFMEN
jgi:hypothetical protein